MQSHLNNLIENSPQKSQFIGLEKLAVGSHVGLSVDRPVDRGLDTESRLSVRSTARSTGAFPESKSSLRSTGSVDRPSSQNWRARLCTSVDRLGRPTSSSVNRSGRPAEARQDIFGIEKLDFYFLNKSHKFTKNLQK